MISRAILSTSLVSLCALFAGACAAAELPGSTALSEPSTANPIKKENLAEKFHNYKAGCFELLDCNNGNVFRYNSEQCAKRLPPMSTFKIFNSLAGLETGVLKDENHLMKWDGQKRWNDSWNKDQTLQSAVSNSVVWYFQKVAEGVGEERMRKYLAAADYGNQDISGGITKFWLASSMQISADEQVQFIKKLYFDEFPFSKRSMAIVKKITELKKTAKGDLHGKTGSDMQNDKWVLGWFVGYVVHNNHAYIFATNLQGDDGAWGVKAKEITISILEDAGLL
jgi:beta-lactamase class D